MEKIDGSNLSEWLAARNNQPISQEQAIHWLEQLAEILELIHQQKYFHRDIKPSNIMLRPNDQLALIDFGAVREVTKTYMEKLAKEKITEVVSRGFTPQEQIEGKAVPQSDFFSLGRTFVYLLTGTSPLHFPEQPQTAKLLWRSNAPHISKSLAGLIDYLMAPFPGKRPQNAREILNCLAEIKAIPHLNRQVPVKSPCNQGEGLQEDTEQNLSQVTTNILPIEFNT
jgi:serine/threonine protein kinase